MNKINKIPFLKDGLYTVLKVVELNFFDLMGERSKTKGTSSKFYHIELHKSTNDNNCQIHTVWGATGAKTPIKEWRYYDSELAALKDFGSIIKSKTKKGYVEVDVAQRAYGSDATKQITKAVILKNAEELKAESKSVLHNEVQRFVSELFNITNTWVVKTLRCPLGQLTNKQIDEGRDILNSAQDILDNNAKLSKSKVLELERLTNDFYAKIPHNLGQGARGQLTELLLDDKIKVAQKNEDLDLLLDAKAAGASLSNSSTIDEKYKTLDSEVEYINHDDPIFKWVDKMVQDTRASNHHFLGKIKVHNIFKLHRNPEEKLFLENAKQISKSNPKFFMPSILEGLVEKRPDVDKETKEFYRTANVLPVWHGTRRANVVGISMKGFLIRPAGAILAGSMYGHGIYTATNSSKSINYCDVKNSYWATGNSDRAFLFLCDVAFGKPKLASGSYGYTKHNIGDCHSVWAKAGSSIINDELIIYNPAGPQQQHRIRYIVEFETGAK